MDSPRFVTHRGANILVLDYSGAGLDRLPGLLQEAERVIRSHPLRSVLILTRLAGTEFSAGANKLLLEHLTNNGPYALASAVVGLGHLAGVIPIANRLGGRDLRAFDDATAALEWLASHASQEPRPEEEPVRFTELGSCRVLRIDFRRCSPDELMRRIDVAATIIRAQPERTVLTLTLVHGVSYDKETTSVMKEYVRRNRPFVLAGAVVGLDYLRQIVMPLNRLTGRNLRAFDDEEAAMRWLVSEQDRSRAT